MKYIKGDLLVRPQTLMIVDDNGPVAQCFDIRTCLEVSLALNEHDALVAERDELAKQRNALCAALALVRGEGDPCTA